MTTGYFQSADSLGAQKVPLIYEYRSGDPLSTFGAVFKGSILYEDDETNGVSFLIRRLITCPSAENTLAQLLESTAARVDSFSNKDSFGFMIRSMAVLFDQTLQLFAAQIKNFNVDEKTLARVKKEALIRINRSEHRIEAAYRKAFYQRHPYRLPKDGSTQSIARLRRDDIDGAYRRLVNASNMVVFFSGDAGLREVAESVSRTFDSFSGPPVHHTAPTSAYISGGLSYVNIESGGLAFVVTAYPVAKITDDRRPIFDIITAVLQDRLKTELREKRALAYFFQTSLDTGVAPGGMLISVACSPSKTETVSDIVAAEVRKLSDGFLNGEDLDRARAATLDNMFVRLDAARPTSLLPEIAYRRLYAADSVGFFEQSIETLRGAGLDDLRRVAAEYFRQNGPTVLICGPVEPRSGWKPGGVA